VQTLSLLVKPCLLTNKIIIIIIMLKELDATIALALTTEQDLEDEVGDAEMYHFSLIRELPMEILQLFCTN